MSIDSEVVLSSEILEMIIRMEDFLEESKFLEKERKSDLIRYLQDCIRICKEIFRDGLDMLQTYPQDDYLEKQIHKSMLRTSFLIQKIMITSRFLQQMDIRYETDILFDELFRAPDAGMGVRKPSIVLLPEYNFSQRDIEFDIVKLFQEEEIFPKTNEEAVSFVSYPNILYRNPLMWGILVHEIGHKIDKSKGICENLVREYKRLEKQKATIRWFSEFFADLFSVRILGPAFAVSYIFFCLPLTMNIPSAYHPPDRTRIEAQIDYLEKEMGLKDIYFLKDLHKLFEESISNLTTDKKPYEEWKELLDSSREMISIVSKQLRNLPIESFTNENLRNSGDLAKDLSKQIPIGSRPPSFEQLKQSLIKKNQENRKTESLLNGFVHSPSKICEILNAGWIDKQENRPKKFTSLFMKQNILKEKIYERAFKDYAVYILERDKLLLKSIETSSIHHTYGRLK